LCDQIRKAFPAESFSGCSTAGCVCDECQEIAALLRGKRWDEITDEIMDICFGALPLLSEQAITAFLPAWLIRSLNCVGAKEIRVREWTLYELAIYSDEEDSLDDVERIVERRRRLRAHFTAAQVEAVRRFLLLIGQASSISDWDRESIGGAVDLIWQTA